MRSENPKLEIAAVTASSDAEAVAGWHEKVGAELSILRGASKATLESYDVTDYPTYRVLADDGTVAGRDEATLKARLAAN